MNFSIIKSSTVNNLKERILKVIEFGAKTAFSVSSFGDDSSPLPEMTAIYGTTSVIGESVIIGYINKNQIAEDGEKRIFSLKADGSLSIDIHLKNDGTLEIGGNADNAVRFEKLDAALQQFKEQVNAELVKASVGISTAGGVYAHQPTSVDIQQAKVEEVKLS